MEQTKPKETESVINTKDSNWGWFNILKTNKHLTSLDSTEKQSSKTSSIADNEFEVVQQASNSKSYTASYDHLLLENNLEQKINDQYVNLNEYGSTLPKLVDEDEEKPSNDHCQTNENESEPQSPVSPRNDDNVNVDIDPVMISQTLTLKTRNAELEQERDELRSETLQLRMQTHCLRQTNEHIIAAQQKEMENLHSKNKEIQASLDTKITELKAAQQQIAALKRERDSVKKKLHDICYSRLHNNIVPSTNMSVSAEMTTESTNGVLISDKHVVYGCIQCGQHLFDSSALIQRQIEIDDHTFGLIVEGLIGNTNDTTMGPTVCKTFLNGMFKVKEVFCDGCLSTYGWKIIESFDEWNEFYANKFCVDISTIKQISIGSHM